MGTPQELIAGRYRLTRRIAAGGMGVVWEARDEVLQRPVAVKQLRTTAGVSEDEAAVAKDRAVREGRITARLHHPNAVPVFDSVEHDGEPCLVMQYVPSQPLSALLGARGALAPGEVARIGAQVAAALAAAHGLGIVHRDVKPGNILIADADGTALISDFGISHAMGDATLTAANLVHGTPAYLAPEVARGEDSTFASDVFSLGSTLYAAAEGAAPFGDAANPIAVLHRVASGGFAAPQRSGSLGPLLLQMMADDPDARPAMADVARQLAALQGEAEGTPPPALPLETAAETATEAVAIVAPTARFEAPPPAPAPAPTRVLAADDPAPPPDAPTVVPDAERRRRRPLPLVLAVLGVLLVAAIGVALLRGVGAGTGSAEERRAAPVGGASADGAVRTSAPTASGIPSPRPSPSITPSPSATPSRTPSRTSTPTRTPPSSPTPTATPSAAGSPSAAELAGAISSYYALLPGGTGTAFGRLTPSYQQSPAGGRGGFQRFWNRMERVSATNVQGLPPDRAEATITYVYRNGNTSVERTAFRLVRQDGVLKIAASTVETSTG